MTTERTSHREFAELMADHVFGDLDRDELLAVIDGESKSDHIRDDCGTTGPGFDSLFLVGASHSLGFAENVGADAVRKSATNQ